jgi:hypothetical protein
MFSILSEIQWTSDTIMITLIFALPIVSVVAGVWYKVSKAQSDNELKRSMVERGMSADEIQRVLNARTPKD